MLSVVAAGAVRALRTHPRLSSTLDLAAGVVSCAAAEHLGIVVDLDGGLLVPVVEYASDLEPATLAARITDLTARARLGQLAPEELGRATFTICDIGRNGALFEPPILIQPQVGILGVGSATRRAVVMTDGSGRDSIAVRTMVFLALTYDHRSVDGADAGRFLTAVKAWVETTAPDAGLIPRAGA